MHRLRRRPGSVVQNVAGLVNVQLSRFSIRPDAIPIEDPVRQIAGLLRLEKLNALADRVQRPGRKIKCIVWFHRNAPQNFAERSVFDPALVLFARRRLRPPEHELGARLGLENHPTFRLTERLVLDALRICIVRMNLHRKVLARIDDLGEQRAQFRDRFAGVGSAADRILVPALPRFAERRVRIAFFSVVFDESIATPDSGRLFRLDYERLQRLAVHDAALFDGPERSPGGTPPVRRTRYAMLSRGEGSALERRLFASYLGAFAVVIIIFALAV